MSYFMSIKTFPFQRTGRGRKGTFSRYRLWDIIAYGVEIKSKVACTNTVNDTVLSRTVPTSGSWP